MAFQMCYYSHFSLSTQNSQLEESNDSHLVTRNSHFTNPRDIRDTETNLRLPKKVSKWAKMAFLSGEQNYGIAFTLQKSMIGFELEHSLSTGNSI